MNQKSRQTATSNIKKDFYKLLNNSNFGIDVEITLTIAFLNQYMMTFQKLLI